MQKLNIKKANPKKVKFVTKSNVYGNRNPLK